MNASAIVSEEMTLEQKLAAIDEAMKSATEKLMQSSGRTDAPVDPASLLICDGCE